MPQLATAATSAATSAATPIDIPYTLRRLDNGLTVVVHEDRKAPIVAVNVWYHVGSKNEVRGRTGFAHLFEHLMFQGSENLKGEYLNTLQELGATDLNGTTFFDRTNYFQTVPSNALDTALWLESDRMGHFKESITQAKLDEQRGVVQNEKRQGDNQPYGKVFEEILKNLFPPEHPYSWETIGSMDDLNAASLADVKKWFETYSGPSNAVVVIAGAGTGKTRLLTELVQGVEERYAVVVLAPMAAAVEVLREKGFQQAATVAERHTCETVPRYSSSLLSSYLPCRPSQL